MHVRVRLTLYAGLLRPRGWVGLLASVLAVVFAVLSFWRDEGPADAQPPQLVADALDWLPWWTWILVTLVAALFVVMESAYKLSEAAAEQSAKTSATLRNQIVSLEAVIQRDDLIRVTPSQATSHRPMGQRNISSEVIAYLDVETAEAGNPLRNCRIKLTDLFHHMAYTDRGKGVVVERWDRDTFYAGQTYFFRWSGRATFH